MYDQPELDFDAVQGGMLGGDVPASNRTMRHDMEHMSRAKQRTSLRDLGRENVAKELAGMGIDRVTTTVRLRATITAKSAQWCEVSLELSIHPEEWWPLGGNPFLVARMGDMTAESRSVYAIALIKQVLNQNNVEVDLGAGSLRLGAADTEEWSWWAHLQSRLSVAVQVQTDGSVRVVGLR